jgi:hypothetical protein
MAKGFLDRFKTKPRTADNVVPLKLPTNADEDWVQLPKKWAEVLLQSSGTHTVKLAILILFAEFRRRLKGKDIRLTTKATGMSRSSRLRAANELVRLGLIEIERNGRRPIRVTHIHYLIEGKNKKRRS